MREVKHTLREDCRTTHLNHQNKRAQNPLRAKKRGTQQSEALDCSNYHQHLQILVISPPNQQHPRNRWLTYTG